MRSWVYGAGYGAALSAIVLVAASLLIPRAQIIGDDPPAAQIDSEGLVATANAESKSITVSAAEDSVALADAPGAVLPDAPEVEVAFAGAPDLPKPDLVVLDLIATAAPKGEAAASPPEIVNQSSPGAMFAMLGSGPAADPAPRPDRTRPPYYAAPIIEPTAGAEPKPEPAPEAEPQPVAPEPEVALATPEPAAEPVVTSDEPVEPVAQPAESGALPQVAEGTNVRIIRPDSAAEAEAAVEPETIVVAEGGDEADGLDRNATIWTDPGLPKIAIILTGTPGDDFSLPGGDDLPLAFEVDALEDGADAEIAGYREAGQEVVLATPLPEGATAADVNVAFEAYGPRLASVVAVMEAEPGSFGARQVAAAVIDLAAADGIGVVSASKGLNPVKQLAGPAGVHAGLVDRDLSDATGDAGALARALDQAAFKAGQEGAVILIAPASSEVVDALRAWQDSPRGKTVAIAPLSAVLKGL